MAITAEYLAQLIEKVENIQAVFDEQILPKEGESAESFQHRKQDLIDQTMVLVGKGPEDTKVPNRLEVPNMPIIEDCLGTPLTEGYVDSEGNTYDVSNIDKIPENLSWQNDKKPVVNRTLNDNLDAINEQFLKVMIAKQWIIENIPSEQQKDYLKQQVTVSDDDYPENLLRCPILFDNFNSEEGNKAFIYEDGYSVSLPQQPKSPFTNLSLAKDIGTPNILLDKLAADYAAALAEYKQIIQQYPGLQEFVEVKMKEQKAIQAAEIEKRKEKQKQEKIKWKEEQAQEKQAIQKYTRLLGIRAQLNIERNKNVDVRNENFQKINQECLFAMDRIRTHYPNIETQISPEVIEKARLNYKNRLDRIWIKTLGQYDAVRKELFELTDKIHDVSLTVEESDKAIDRQFELREIQKHYEKEWPEIRHALLLNQARGIFTLSKDPLKVLSLQECTGEAAHPPYFSGGNNSRFNTTPAPSSSNSNGQSGTISSLLSKFGQLFSTPAPAANPLAPAYDYSVKIAIIGDNGVGKSSLLERFSEKKFSEAFISTIGIDCKVKDIALNQSRVRLNLLDMQGQDRFREIHFNPVQWYRGAQAFMIAFAVDDRQSFDTITKWLKELDTFARTSVTKTLVATKCDIPEGEWVICKEEIKALADGLKINAYFTSAKDNFNVTSLFTGTAESILEENKSRHSNRM